jgi:peptide/nickel transport system substrate-binding protein
MTKAGERPLSAAPAKNLASQVANSRKTKKIARRNAIDRRARYKYRRPIFWPLSQLLNRQPRSFALISAMALAVSLTPGCRRDPTPATTSGSTRIQPGGEIAVSLRAEPRSFNRFVARDTGTALFGQLTQGKLIRINQVTQDLEPWLAESWTPSPDGLRVTMKLRPNVTFSDGYPFTADDVLFSFEAAYDEKSSTVINDAIRVAGKRLAVTAVDPHTIEIVFPAPFAPGVRILDSLPIVAKHKLAAALKAGTFASAWGLSTPPAEIVGLGPFVFKSYSPGQRIVFERNPYYFRKAVDGTRLPYLDRITVEVVPDPNTDILRLDASQLDTTVSEIAPEAYAPLKRTADAGRVKLLDLGVAYNADGLWFNLRPGALGTDSRAAWLQRDELRKAISMAVDRQVFADTVFLGAGVPVYGPETPANKPWYWDGPKTPHDPAAAKQLLASIGLTDRNNDGILEDAHNQPARFTLITQKGRPNRERAAVVIRDELKKIGLVVDAVPLEAGALIERFLSSKYEAIYFNADKTDLDPAGSLEYWMSSGGAHVWNIAEKTPATAWERQIDGLMAKQIASPDRAERKRIYDEIQKIFAEHLPVVYFAAPRIYVVASQRLANLTPAVLPPQLLWSADTLAVAH